VRITGVNDRSVSIRSALHDVTLTMLGHDRARRAGDLPVPAPLRRTVIPTLSLPVSLVGAISLLWGFGYTMDNISLLGLTLAVGLVVDDAIVMLENIMRHVEEGMPPFQARCKARARSASPSSRSRLADRRLHPDLLHAGVIGCCSTSSR
jgi:HAE1 family hydrophobic/amphiphilic exporter-1